MTTATYLRAPHDETSEVSMNSTYQFASAGALMGLLFGIVVAATTGSALGPMGARDAGSVNSKAATVSASSASPAVQAVQAPAAPIQAQQQTDSSIVPAVYAAMIEAPATPALPPAHAKLIVHKPVTRKPAPAAQVLQVPAAELAAASFPAAGAAATQKDTPKPFAFTIQGDATVVDFDASTGTIETTVGKSFTIGTTGADDTTIPWQDYSGNLHYSCDQGGNCTLSGNGVVVSSVRQAT